MARGKSKLSEKYNTPFASALRQLMLVRDCTQDVLAIVTGRTRQTVSQYVNGVSEPPYDVLVKIAEYFNVTTDYLLGLTTDPNRKPSAADEIGLSPESIAVLRGILLGGKNHISAVDALLRNPLFPELVKYLFNTRRDAARFEMELVRFRSVAESVHDADDKEIQTLDAEQKNMRICVMLCCELYRDIVNDICKLVDLNSAYWTERSAALSKTHEQEIHNGND